MITLARRDCAKYIAGREDFPTSTSMGRSPMTASSYNCVEPQNTQPSQRSQRVTIIALKRGREMMDRERESLSYMISQQDGSEDYTARTTSMANIVIGILGLRVAKSGCMNLTESNGAKRKCPTHAAESTRNIRSETQLLPAKYNFKLESTTPHNPSTDQAYMSKILHSTYFATFSEDCQAAVHEFVGTVFFLLLGLGGIQAVSSEDISGAPLASTVEQVMYISTAMGLSLLVSAWLFFRVTGGLFNPNVSLALLLVGVIRPVRFVLYCIAQLVGGIAASALVLALTPGPIAFNTLLGPGINAAQGVFIEMFITSMLVLSVLMLAAEKHQVTPFAPVGIGLTLFAAHLFAVYYTGASLNTARSFGPAAVSGFPSSKQWVYWVGPFLGSLLGAGFYTILKQYRYWKLNPNQAAVEEEKSPANPVKTAKALIAPQSEYKTESSGPSGEGGTQSQTYDFTVGRSPNDAIV